MAAGNCWPAEVIDLAPFEVVDSRLPGETVSGQVISISSDDMADENPFSLWDAMNAISEIQVEQAAGLGGNASIYVRGGEPNSAKVLLDGMDVGNILDIRGGSYNFNGIGLNAVEQMSLLPGPRSAIHGSDALSGVISISTMPVDWETRPTSGQSGIAAGQGGLFEAFASQDLRLEKAFIRTAASFTREDSWMEGSEFEAKRINLGAVSQTGKKSSIQFTSHGTWIDRTHYPDDSGGPVYAVWDGLDIRETGQYGGNLQTTTSLNPDMVLRTMAYYFRFDEFVDSPGVAPGERDPFGVPPNSVDNRLDRYQLSSHLIHALSPRISLVYGASYLQEEGDSHSTVVYPFGTIEGGYVQAVATLSAFAETGWQLSDGIRLNTALRYDDVEAIDAVWTGRLESVLQLESISSQLSAVWGSGFKKPTFFALGNPVIGNPDLLPEESDLYELTLRTEFSEGRIVLSNAVFRQEYENLIDFSEAPPPRMVNLNKAVMEGFSSRLDMNLLDDTSVGINITYVDTEVVDSDELLRNRPNWKAGFTFYQRIANQVSLVLRAHYVGKRLDSSIPTGTRELDAYFRIDTGLNWEIRPGMHLGLFVDNLLDEEYEELVGFVSSGTRIRGTTRFRW